MKKYKVLFIGGSAYACAGAIKYKDDAVVLENNIVLAPEFTLSYAKNNVSAPISAFAETFYEKVKEKGLIQNSKIHLMPTADVMAELMLGKNIYLDSSIINITKEQNLYKVDFWSQGGINTIYAENIIDTTEKGYDNAGEKYIKAQYMCGALNISTEMKGTENCFFVKGAFEDEMYFVCKIPAGADYPEARKLFYEEWKKLKRTPDVLLVSEGQKMIYEYERNIDEEIAEKFRWIPSMQFKDIVCALEEGMKCSF